jgi:hypothetical protein
VHSIPVLPISATTHSHVARFVPDPYSPGESMYVEQPETKTPNIFHTVPRHRWAAPDPASRVWAPPCMRPWPPKTCFLGLASGTQPVNWPSSPARRAPDPACTVCMYICTHVWTYSEKRLARGLVYLWYGQGRRYICTYRAVAGW